MFSFKYKKHNCLKEENKEHKIDNFSRDTTKSGSSKSKFSTRGKAIEKKLRVVYDDIEGTDFGIGKNTKKKLPKKFKDNEVNLPNVPKEVVIQRIILGHCEYKTYPGIKFQSPWSNANAHQFGSNYQFCDTGPETRSEKMRKFLKTEERTKLGSEIPAGK